MMDMLVNQLSELPPFCWKGASWIAGNDEREALKELRDYAGRHVFSAKEEIGKETDLLFGFAVQWVDGNGVKLISGDPRWQDGRWVVDGYGRQIPA